MRAISIAGSLLLAASCSGSDSVVYTPAGASVWNDGYPAAVTPVPSGAPAGTLEVASFGLVELAPADLAPLATFHVRIAIANTASDRPWNVSLASATIRAGESESRALLANSDLATLPVVLVDRGARRTIDLYFAPPPGVREEEDLAELDFSLQLGVSGRMVQTRTHFVRREPVEMTGARKELVRVAGWGDRWWADPAYPWPSFYRRPGIANPRPPSQVAVNRMPRWQRVLPPRSAQQ